MQNVWAQPSIALPFRLRQSENNINGMQIICLFISSLTSSVNSRGHVKAVNVSRDMLPTKLSGLVHADQQESRNFELKIGLDSQKTKYPPPPPPPPPPKKKKRSRENKSHRYLCIKMHYHVLRVEQSIYPLHLEEKNLNELLNYGQY